MTPTSTINIALQLTQPTLLTQSTQRTITIPLQPTLLTQSIQPTLTIYSSHRTGDVSVSNRSHSRGGSGVDEVRGPLRSPSQELHRLGRHKPLWSPFSPLSDPPRQQSLTYPQIPAPPKGDTFCPTCYTRYRIPTL